MTSGFSLLTVISRFSLRMVVSQFHSALGTRFVMLATVLFTYCRDRSKEFLQPSSLNIVPRLVVLNLMLQAFDGLATYHGLMLGVQEGNPIMRAAMMQWGVAEALLGTKGAVCLALPLFLFLRHRRLSVWALALIAGFYLTLSFVPWLTIFLTEAQRIR